MSLFQSDYMFDVLNLIHANAMIYAIESFIPIVINDFWGDGGGIIECVKFEDLSYSKLLHLSVLMENLFISCLCDLSGAIKLMFYTHLAFCY